MSDLFTTIKGQVTGKNVRIVLPEGTDERTVGAAARLKKENIVTPILLGNKGEVEAVAKEIGVSVEGIAIHEPATDPLFDELVAAFVERRKG
ncbi:phosphate acetyltransferase, partial [Listeria booriae]|uniref:phosphate acyltransferase n=1 Tax=Listeria booriae TaxID=1552123 RepID=UPI0017CCE21A